MILFVAPESEAHEAILDVLTKWSALGLVMPFAWWALGAGESVDPPRRVDLVKRGQRIETALANALAEASDAHDVIAVELVGLEAGHPLEWLNNDAGRARAAVRDILSDEQLGESLHVLVPVNRGARADVGQLVGGWDHVCLIPDNRTAPNGGVDYLADHPEIVPLHTAHALAALAGIVEGSSHDEPSTRTQLATAIHELMPSELLGVRVFSHTVDFGRLLDDLSAGLGTSAQDPPLPGSEYSTLEPTEMQLDGLATAYVAAHGTTFGPSAEEPEPPEEPIRGLVPYIKLIFAVLKSIVLHKPAEWAAMISQRVYDGIAERLEGVGKSVTGRSVDRWNMPVDEPEPLDVVQGLAVGEEDGAVAPAFRDLVGVVLSLIDGGLIPTAVSAALTDEQRGGSRNRIIPARFLVSDPDKDEGRAAGRTLIDRIARAVVVNHEAAVAAVTAVEADLDRVTNDVEAARVHLERAGRASMFRRIVTGFVLSSLISAAGVAAALRFLDGPLRVALVATSPIAWLVLFTAFMVRTVHRRIRRQRRHLELQRELRRIERHVLVLKADAARIERRCRDIADWHRILTRFLNQPLTGRPVVGEQSVQMTGALLPPSLRVAAAMTEAVRTRLTALCTNRVFAPGWLARIFDNLVAEVMAHLVSMRGEPRAALVTVAYDPFADVSTRPDSPRRFLLAQLTRGTTSSTSTATIDEEFREELGKLKVGEADGIGESATLLAHSAEIDAGEIADGGVSDLTILNGSMVELQTALRPSVVRIRTSGPNGEFGATGFVASADGLVITNRHVVDGATTIVVELSSGARLPAVSLGVSSTTDLAALRVGLDQLQPLQISSSLPSSGQTVYTLGYPLLMDGEPTFTRGSIAAVDRTLPSLDDTDRSVRVVQADFRLAGGASGSPVVDGAGDVVGVHFSSLVRPQSVTDEGFQEAIDKWSFAAFLVPCDELHEYVAEVIAREGFAPPIAGRANLLSADLVRVREFLDVQGTGASSVRGFGGTNGRPAVEFRELTTTASPVGRPLSDLHTVEHGRPVRVVQSSIYVAAIARESFL